MNQNKKEAVFLSPALGMQFSGPDWDNSEQAGHLQELLLPLL
jgi:hypothetical protein